MNNTLRILLQILGTAAGLIEPLLSGDPTASQADKLAEALIRIAQAANDAHLDLTGKPIDLGALHPIDPLPPL